MIEMFALHPARMFFGGSENSRRLEDDVFPLDLQAIDDFDDVGILQPASKGI